MNANKSTTNHDALQSRRRDLKRLALLGAAVFVPAILASAGCQTMKDAYNSTFHKEPRKESKTVDDVLSAERPSW